MLDAALALQESVFKALLADPDLTTLLGSNAIFDRVPEKQSMPYLVIGRSTTSDWSTATEGGEAVIFFVHVWSKDTSRSEVHALQSKIKEVLTADLPPLDGHKLINFRFQLAETRRDRTDNHFHGVMRFRAVTEPIV